MRGRERPAFSPTRLPRRLGVEGAVLLVSACALAYQIVLMRVFSIAQWHHFAYMIISVAMLGFGAGGTVLSLLQRRIAGREEGLLSLAALGVALSFPLCYLGSQRIPFETFELVSQPGQPLYLFLLYAVLSVPFFLASIVIALAFLARPEAIGRVYFFSMLGSGVGAIGAVALLYWAHPATIACLMAAPALAAHLIATRGRLRWLLTAAPLLLLVLAVAGRDAPAALRLSEYKGLSYARLYPDTEIVGTWCNPLSVVTAVRSDQIRETPGQIGNYPMRRLGILPAQVGLYFDGGAVSPVHDFADGNLDRFAFLDYVTSAVAYRLTPDPKVLVIGAGGGTDVLSALRHGAKHVTAIDVDPKVFDIVRGPLGEFSGGLYNRPKVSAVVAEGRAFARTSGEEFDLIQLPLVGALGASAAGVHALDESYLYTVEAFGQYLDRLSGHGVLVANCWLKAPPRDAIKLFATAAAACERIGIPDPARHLLFLRSWNNATVAVTRSPLSDAQIAAVHSFCAERGFDLCYYPGMRVEEANRFTVLERPAYVDAAEALLSSRRDDFLQESLFYIYPATDDRPFFFRSFRWRALPQLLRHLGTQWIPFVEWGYLTLVATVAQSALAGLILVALPLMAGGPRNVLRQKHARRRLARVALYFAALGTAYMFLEIAFIQRFMLFLASPIHTVAVVLCAFLTFSGLGSLCSGRLQARPENGVRLAVAGVIVMAILYVALLWVPFATGATWPLPLRAAASVILLAPLAFCMGMPFPLGMQRLSDHDAGLVPWAWCINGCASVTGATLATFTAIHLGFRAVVLIACATYLIAAWGFTFSADR